MRMNGGVAYLIISLLVEVDVMVEDFDKQLYLYRIIHTLVGDP